MGDQFGKGDGLGVVDDHDVLARELDGIEKSLKAARDKLKGGDPSKDLGDALASMDTLRNDVELTRKRLETVEGFILDLSRFVDNGKLKQVLHNKTTALSK